MSTPSNPPAAKEPIFTANFALACLGSFAAFSSFYFLLASLPVYVTQVGGDESSVGMIIGTFSVTAVLLRLPLGRAADERGKVMFMLAGAALMAVCGGLYAFAHSVGSLVAIRIFHGIGWSLFGTTISALVADIIPKRRRGEAMGYYGIFANLAMAIGPAAGVFLTHSFSFGILFAASAAMAGLAFVATLPIRERRPERPPAGEARQAMIERSSLFPSLVLLLLAMSYGAIVTFVPLYAKKQGIGNPGIFFSVYAVTLVLSRSFAGKLSDKRGRAAVIVPGLVLSGAALALLSTASSLPTFLAVAVLFGLGFASVQPALMAMVVDRAPPNRRGAAMGTFATAMDLGIGGGSFIWGFVAKHAGYGVMFLSAGMAALIALAIFWRGQRAAAQARAAQAP